MSASTLGLFYAAFAGINIVVSVGLLIWLVVKARSKAKGLVILGMALMLLPSLLTPLIAGLASLADEPLMITMLNSAFGLVLGLAGLVMVTVGFLRADRVAAETERRTLFQSPTPVDQFNPATRPQPGPQVAPQPTRQPWTPPQS